jgi:hypothetical protein
MTPSEPLFAILPCDTTTLSFQPTDDRRVECRLTCQITLDQYQTIDRAALFNLKPELRGALTHGEFQPDAPLTLSLTLQPDLLPQLAEFTAAPAIDHLHHLSQTQPDHPLLNPASWYALQVSQTHHSGETGYRTLWDYLNPAVIVSANLSSAEIADRLVRFFQDNLISTLTNSPSDALETTLTQISDSFDQWLQTSLAEGDRVVDQAIDTATNALEEFIDTLTEAVEDLPPPSLYEAMIRFFTEDDWSFTKLQGEPLLQMGFQGNNGEWTCYAKAREDQQQFVFYSLCPVVAPEPQRSPIAEFLTRANYGMILGNFELDWDDGEIRYKTSIDVTDSTLTSALIKSIVYTNVLTMDQYLPGIQAVIDGVGAIDALRQVEAPTEASTEVSIET